MDSKTIRKTFLDFYAERGHTIVPSASVVPDDPTLLFTTAGMVQFKALLEGVKAPPYDPPRAAGVQKCFRTTDLEIVGKTKRHLTFFEMLGNWSFGDYFKKEAIHWAWELVTERFRLEPDRLWATVFLTDEESVRIWRDEVGLREDRILRRGREDGNFWDMGVAGPCGPCSELHFDRGHGFGEEYTGSGELDEERYVEVYNLVFMQHVQNDALEIVGDLPRQSVDTGLGIERLAAILQDAPTVFEIDSMAPILERAQQVLGLRYGDNAEADISIRVLTEHGRAMTFLVADGVLPTNEGRGYVLRRLIRRAVRYARLAGVDESVLVPVAEETIERFAGVYPELARNRDLVMRVVEREEARFDQTLRQGLGTLEGEIAAAKTSGAKTISGETAFRLHDTYGFPLDLTTDIASEEGLTVDLAEFEELMTRQRERARAARGGAGLGAGRVVGGNEASREALAAVAKTEFLGYQQAASDSTVVGVVAGLREKSGLPEGGRGEVVLDRSPFYPEGGGQVGDRGRIETETGTFRVEDCTWGVPGVIIHIGEVVSGELRAGQAAQALVDAGHREGVRQSHTATHMLHWALRHHLGEHARQQGSLVEPGRLRFDFSHFEPVSPARLSELEEEINVRAITDDPVRAFETTYDYAMSIGATALFGEKYGEFVRVVEVGEYSKELCGGTHVSHTGQVGVVKLVAESSVGAGLRRVEAYTGMAGLRFLNAQAERLKQAAALLRVEPDRVVEQLEKTLEAKKGLESQLTKQRSATQREEIGTILSQDVKTLGSSRLVVIRRDGRDVGDLRRLASAIRDEIGSGIVVIGSAQNGKANLVAASTRDLLDRGLSSQTLLSQGAAILGGGAGGEPDLAVAGGPKGEEIDRAIAAVESAVRAALENS